MVIDIGGHASWEFIDAAVDTKFWQVIGTGLDDLIDANMGLGKW